MQRDSGSNPASPASNPHPLGLYPILAIVLLWNCGYKGVRVANTLYVLDLGAGPLDTGLLLATYGAVPLFLAIFTGKINNSMHVTVPALFGAVGSLLGLAPVFWLSSAILVAGGCAARSGGT
ncbi:MAG TPA: hypothetical protein VMN03_10755 [Burkholderiales bacterium]|nr:hypothetical protein [Burkholderiales bacterium]